VRLVGNDDNVFAFRIRPVLLHVLVEFLNERKDVRLLQIQMPVQVLSAYRPARVAVVVHNAATGKGFINLRVQIITVGQHQKREIPAEFAVDFPGKQNH